MRYFLKKTTPTSKGVYLQIYQTYYLPKVGKRNKSYQKIGYVSDLINNGIPDPISYYQTIVDNLNKQIIDNESLQIGEISLTKNIGYFLLKGVIDLLKTNETIDIITQDKKTKNKISDFINTMIYAQVCNPGSKLTAYEKVIPNLYNATNFSYDQILDYINYIGKDYEKYIEIFNHQIESVFGKRKTNTTYFDCTNYYFEIDLPFEDKQKGPSKENRKSPIIGQALLLDEEQIPIAMKMYPGNKSEKPYLRQTIEDIKERFNIKSKIVQVADKGLNCARNIYAAAVEAKDGYIFSKAIRGKSLPKTEKEWLLLDDNISNKWTNYYESDGKTISHRMKECIDTFEYRFENENGEIITFKVKEKRIVSYNAKLANKQKAEIQREIENLKSKLTAKAISREELGDATKYVKIKTETANGEKAKTIISIDNEKIEEELKYAGYNLIVTSETNKSAKEIYNAYHGLWRIEESFRILKSYLEARSVFLQLKESIYGHFLICYLSLVVLRILEIKIFNDELAVGRIIDFIRGYNITETKEGSFINSSTASETYSTIKNTLQISKLGNVYLNKRDVDSLLELHLEDLF